MADDAVSIRNRGSYLQLPSQEALTASQTHMLGLLEYWSQQVRSGQIVSILTVAVGPDYACRTYMGGDEQLPNVVELGAVGILVADVERRLGLREAPRLEPLFPEAG